MAKTALKIENFELISIREIAKRCKINERTALSSPRVAKAMTQANAAYLVGDWTRRDDAITRELQAHGRSGVPLYLLYRPGQAEPEILPQLLTEGVVIDALKK